ncbi:MAG: DUF5011 domain-containing protein, partial [Gammaproteobacteria bacterium]|nr:DUF5011 domain-containing protein [Gammaproteobacteria bacterium]
SNGIDWTTNFPGTTEITTGRGASRTGQWAGYDASHGFATGTVTQCDIDNPPPNCLPLDGLSGSGTALVGVGAYVTSITTGSSVSIILDGGTPQSIATLAFPIHQFMGIIDPAGFSSFQYREIDGKIGQELPIFFDDFILATTAPLPANLPPVLATIGNQTRDEGQLLTLNLSASDPNAGNSVTFSANNLPAGATFEDNLDGTAVFTWTPNFNQAGSYTPRFTVRDDGSPVEQDRETITITVNDVNRPPVLTVIGPRTVEDGNLLSFVLNASDPDGHNIAFSMNGVPPGSGLPAGANLVDNGNGTAQFSWTPDLSQVGSHSIQFNATDDGLPPAGDSEVVSITVTTPDITPPVVTPPTDILVAATNASGTSAGVAQITVFLGGATALDDVDGPITTIGNNAPAVFPLGVTTVTFSASDSAGNTGTAQATVTVADLTPPAITLTGAAVTINFGDPYVDPGFSASDNVDGDLSAAVVVGGNLNENAVGSYTVTYDVSDAAGN